MSPDSQAPYSLRPRVACQPDRTPVRASLAAALLTLCCICWGFSFPATQLAVSAFERAVAGDPAALDLPLRLAIQTTFSAWRFVAAALIYGLLTYRQQRGSSTADCKAGLAVGSLLGLGLLLQILGLRHTLPSVSGFLTAMTVIFTPIGQAWILRRRVGGIIWLAALVALAGTAILSLPNPHAAGSNPAVLAPDVTYLGELLTLLSAVVFAGQILAVAHYGAQVEAARLTWISFGVVALMNLSGGLVLSGGRLYAPCLLSLVWADPAFTLPMAGLVLFSTVAAFHMMNTYQPRVSAATASVIYCLEPVFATLWSLAFGTERLTWVTTVGGAVILAAVLLATGKAPRPSSGQ